MIMKEQWKTLTKDQDVIKKIEWLINLPDKEEFDWLRDLEYKKLNEIELKLLIIALRENGR